MKYPDLISVIIPVYNVEEELARCLESILAQTYPNLEIVAVDDGSTDTSGDILDRYAERYENLHVIHKANGGVTSARLAGIEVANGNWIGFVDGDDTIEPDMYERLLRNATECCADISHCGYQMVFDDGRVNYFHNTGTRAVQDRITAVRELLSGEMIEPGLCNKIFRKALFSKLLCGNVLDQSIKINEDLLMNYHLFLAADTLIYEDWCPYHYIIRSSSASRVKLNKHKIYDPILVKAHIRKSVPEELKADAQRAYLNTCISIYHQLITDDSEQKKDIQQVQKLLQKEKESFSLLGKRAVIPRFICTVAKIYGIAYRFYRRYVQKNVYS